MKCCPLLCLDSTLSNAEELDKYIAQFAAVAPKSRDTILLRLKLPPTLDFCLGAWVLKDLDLALMSPEKSEKL